MKKALLISFVILFAQVVGLRAEEKKFIKGFSGGMMVHAGYVAGSDYPGVHPIEISDLTYGVGGVAKLHLTKHFRAGFEGYFSNAPMNKGVESGSYNKMFWVGGLVDWYWKLDKFNPYVGVSVGGGTETAHYILDGDKHDWLPDIAVYHKQPFFALDPFVGVEYAVGGALHLTMKADWLVAVNSDGFNRPHGPRLYFGVIFVR